ncbi:MAG: uracil-DNA glycosylase [Alphaproteobacteria bacterium]|nr:uracil-DNA glycosylase [Alphaproteobacteria bacterium]
MLAVKDYIDILKFYEESGVDESYGVEPYSFFADKSNIFVKEIEPTPKKAGVNVSILKARQEAEKLVETVDNLTALQQCVSSFTLNPLSKFASHCIYGVGVENPKLLVITEMPNAEEDRSGEAICGATGEMFKKILSAIHCSVLENTYTFPVSPFRTPGARLPTSEEMEIAIPFVKKFIEILKPKVILTMGGLPTNVLLSQNQPVTAMRGKWFEYNGIPVMPTFSLAYLLNNIEAKRKAWADLQLLAEKF